MTSGPKNAIERRFEEVKRHWIDFAEDYEARLLRWHVDAAGASLVLGWLEIANEDDEEIPDLLLNIGAPFEGAEPYVEAVLQDLEAQVVDAQDGLREDGIELSWVRPPRNPGEPAPEWLVRCAASLQVEVKERARAVTLCLAPLSITKPAVWAVFIEGLVEADPPENVRFTVVDRVEQPLLSAWDESEDPRVRSATVEVDLVGAMAEIAANAGGDGPDSEFRQHMVAIAAAAEATDTAAAKIAAKAALQTAETQGWVPMQVVVQMALGGALMGGAEYEEARAAYRRARWLAEADDMANDATAPKLQMQARFGEAGAVLQMQDSATAATMYAEIAPVAKQAEAPLFELESWRMCAFCYEQAESIPNAWSACLVGLQTAEGMSEEVRENTTLPVLAQAILRLGEAPDCRSDLPGARQRLEALLGPEAVAQIEAEIRAS